MFAEALARKIETPEALQPVATALSASLGPPAAQIPAATAAELPAAANTATADLRAGMVEMQRQLAQLNKKLTTYQGKDIEGTGFSVLGPGVTTLVLVLIVLAVIFPPVFALLAFAYRRLQASQSTSFLRAYGHQ